MHSRMPYLLLLLAAACQLSLAARPPVTFHVLHKLPTAATFTPRGEIQLPSNGNAEYIDKVSADDKEAIAKGIVTGDGEAWYKVKVVIPSGREKETIDSLGLTKMCMLRASQMKDEFIVRLDENGIPYHVDYNAQADGCDDQKSTATFSQQDLTWKSDVRVVQSTEIISPLASMPEAAKPKIEYDAEGKVKQPEPEKSFIQKYWMYIVPVLIVFLLGGGDPPKEGGSGGQQK